jgi:hypothetical protein
MRKPESHYHRIWINSLNKRIRFAETLMWVFLVLNLVQFAGFNYFIFGGLL